MLKATDLIPFHRMIPHHNESNGNRTKITKHFWINLVRHQSSTNKTAYFVAKESWTDQDEATSSPFKSFTITFNTDESVDALITGSHIITRNYIPIRLTPADSAAIASFKNINWKTIIAVREYEFEALRFFGKVCDHHLTLPTAALYTKRAHRDLDSFGTHSPPEKRGRTTPAQAFDLLRVNNSNRQPTGSQTDRCDISADIQLNDCQTTNTLPSINAPSTPPTTLQQQVNNANNIAHMRKQRDFPTPGLLKEPHFQHIATQLNRTHPNPFPNIYLRLTVVVNHIYYVFTQDLRHLQTHACITLIDNERLLHFVPIKSPTERHRALWKNFSKANTQCPGFGSWIQLTHLPDLALLSKTIPMREHFALTAYIKNHY